MMFLAGTLHILLFYIVIGFLLIVSVYRNWWSRLINWKRELSSKTKFEILLVSLPVFSVLSVLISHYHEFWHLVNFNSFALASFVILPLSTAYFGVLPFFRRKDGVGLGSVSILLFSFGGFGLAASNFHDVIWCGEATGFFRKFSRGGDDIGIWKTLFQVPRPDYRILGFYMFIQATLFLIMAHLAFSSLKKELGGESTFALKLNWLAMVPLTLAITLIDWPNVISPPGLHTSVIGILVATSAFVFYKSGENLVNEVK